MQNIPDVKVRDREIPVGKVLIAEYGTVPKDDMAQEILLDKRIGWDRRIEVKLIARIGGWNLAGSCLRWDNGAYGVIWSIGGSRHGQWYKTFDDAAAHFSRIPA